jgi:hypothetical protein
MQKFKINILPKMRIERHRAKSGSGDPADKGKRYPTQGNNR